MNTQFSVKDKTILVTGGTSGIGKSIVSALVGSGARVIANYVRDTKKAGKLISELGEESLTVVRADLTRPKGILTLMQAIDGIALDGFIHCAATGVHAPIEQLNMKHWDWTMSLNARAFFELILKLKNQLVSGASVIAMSSEGAARAVPNYTLIGASKAALESLCRHLSVELSDSQIRVNILSPGSVLTDSWNVFPDKEERIAQVKTKIPGNELTTLDEISSVALFLCSDASRGINGQTIVVDRGERIAF